MAIQRHRFDISTDTGGDFVDTGPPVTGLIMQIACDTGVFDTGCDFELKTVQSNVVVADYDNIGGSAWSRVPRLLSFDTGGAEVGDQYPVVANDQLRLTVTQSAGVTGSKTGRLWVWVGS